MHLGVIGAPVDVAGDALAIEAFEAGGESCATGDATPATPTRSR